MRKHILCAEIYLQSVASSGYEGPAPFDGCEWRWKVEFSDGSEEEGYWSAEAHIGQDNDPGLRLAVVKLAKHYGKELTPELVEVDCGCEAAYHRPADER